MIQVSEVMICVESVESMNLPDDKNKSPQLFTFTTPGLQGMNENIASEPSLYEILKVRDKVASEKVKHRTQNLFIFSKLFLKFS